MKQLIEQIEQEFSRHFQEDHLIIKSPGRVNLIGEHTDYNDGFVLPAAIDKVIVLAMASNNNNEINMVAVDKDETHHFGLDQPYSKTGKGWPDYILGVVVELERAGYDIGGFNCVFGGNIPIGAGLSSSAALEGGIITGLAKIFDLDISLKDRALLAQKAENEFVGVQCGIMDQFVNIHGREEQALKLDCRSLEFELYPFKQEDIRIVLCDTNVRRELASSEYNIRRKQCEEGVTYLARHNPEIQSLRDVEHGLLDDNRNEMDEIIYKRCKFVLQENERVQKACEDLQKGDIASFGRQMYASHAGLRDMYQVSCAELDILVEAASKIDGVLGSRMMGGGFGGCTINLVKEAAVQNFVDQMFDIYLEKTTKTVDIYKTKIGGGAEVLSLENKNG